MKVLIVFFTVCSALIACVSSCALSEYESRAAVCCPMCSPGSVVQVDCTEEWSTTCVPCAPGTFMNQPNGLYQCHTCTHCDRNKGLYIKSDCTTTLDTVCDVLDGFHCLGFTGPQCDHAVKHSTCKAGQQTKTPGTKFSDTVCVDCDFGFYSPSGLNCTRWTDCKARNEQHSEDGSAVKDVTCLQKSRMRLLLIPVPLLLFLLCIGLYLWKRSTTNANTSTKSPIEEKDRTVHGTTENLPEENREDEEAAPSTLVLIADVSHHSESVSDSPLVCSGMDR